MGLAITLFLFSFSAIAADAASVLNFELYSEWTHATANSMDATQGENSAVISAGGWTEVVSVPLSTIGTVSSTLSFDIKAPFEMPSYASAKVVVKIPSQGVEYGDLGTVSLAGLSSSQFETYSFAIPSDLAAKFEADYSDLTL